MQKATAQQLKEHNQQLVLKAIYTSRANSRAAIAEGTGLTRPTVSQIVGELLEAGLVQEKGQGESRGGKPPTLLRFTDDAYQIIGLHLGGHRTFGAVTDLRGRILTRAARPTDRTGVESVLTGLDLVLDDLRAQATRPLLGIGVSVPGLIDPRNGVVRYTAYLNWRSVPLGQRLAAHCDDIPIYLDNDTNLAALGERVFGAGDGIDNMVIVMVGTAGIGAGIVVNGEIYHGAGGGAGEIGHMPIASSDVSCVCGHRGCLEAVSSGWALVRQAREAAAAHPDSALNALAAPDDMTLEDVRQAVEAGDPTAVALAQEVGHYLGLVVAILVSTVNPQRVIIGGSVSELGDPLFDSLRRTFGEHTLTILAEETEILPASLGTDVNILGAAAQVLKGELGVV